MSDPLISRDRLEAAGKVLFITHLALGDFTYLQQCLKSLHHAFPGVEIHLWVTDIRTSWRFWRWRATRQDALYQWLASSPFIHRVFRQSESLPMFRASLLAARQENYPIVVSLAAIRPWAFAMFTRWISPRGLRIGTRRDSKRFGFVKKLGYAALDHSLSLARERADMHISELSAGWFRRIFGLELSAADRFPTLSVPAEWTAGARQRLCDWGVVRDGACIPKLFFVSPTAKRLVRSWRLENVVSLIQSIRAERDGGPSAFVVSVPPEQLAATSAFLARSGLRDVHAFSAQHNFFELPAMMSLCDVTISVETGTMHLANAVHVPLVALMRHTTPEWAPIDKERSVILTPPHRHEVVDDITVDRVVDALHVVRVS